MLVQPETWCTGIVSGSVGGGLAARNAPQRVARPWTPRFERSSPKWRPPTAAPRMHGELCKLGLDVSECISAAVSARDIERYPRTRGTAYPIRGAPARTGVSFAPAGTVPSSARVLVADDDSELLEAVAEALTRLGAEVIQASNGAQLIEHLADKGPFDLVVTDIAMPWTTGVRAMRAARTAGLGMPLIVMTALRDDSIPAQVKALGATLLRKPFELAELESTAAKLLAQRRVTAGRSEDESE